MPKLVRFVFLLSYSIDHAGQYLYFNKIKLKYYRGTGKPETSLTLTHDLLVNILRSLGRGLSFIQIQEWCRFAILLCPPRQSGRLILPHDAIAIALNAPTVPFAVRWKKSSTWPIS